MLIPYTKTKNMSAESKIKKPSMTLEEKRTRLLGETFVRLAVVGYGGNGRWICRCECGNQVKVSASHLQKGRTKSCGCYKGALIAKNSRTHNMSYSPEYVSWASAKNRCFNPNEIGYENYGGRGITMCERWASSFENFLADMGKKPTPKHSIDRIDVNGNYEPGNCKWASRQEQHRNRTDSRWIEYKGERLVLADWARRAGMTTANLHRDLKKKTISEIIEKRILTKKMQPL